MQRLIGLLLLIFIPLATMAQTDYPIHDDFRAACRITAPLGRGDDSYRDQRHDAWLRYGAAQQDNPAPNRRAL